MMVWKRCQLERPSSAFAVSLPNLGAIAGPVREGWERMELERAEFWEGWWGLGDKGLPERKAVTKMRAARAEKVRMEMSWRRVVMLMVGVEIGLGLCYCIFVGIMLATGVVLNRRRNVLLNEVDKHETFIYLLHSTSAKLPRSGDRAGSRHKPRSESGRNCSIRK